MKYYIIAGEASGDLHASRLIKALKSIDDKAEFRFFGGDLMAKEAGVPCVKHYREMAYMGFVPVLLHLRTISKNMAFCKSDITAWQPNVVILVDYPGFNLNIAKYLKASTSIPAYYYISPKIWAWKEYRIKNIKRDISEMFSILPFEVDFYERKHDYPIHYVGNPTAGEVDDFLGNRSEEIKAFRAKNGLDETKPIIAVLAGSRQQEIKDNLPAMLEAANRFSDAFQIVLAGAPSINHEYYGKFINSKGVSIVYGQTYALLANSMAALVTSGTATLETALFGVPQVVCYETPLPKLISFLRRHIIKVPYISLVNLIGGREIVRELVADGFTVENITHELGRILTESAYRSKMLQGYELVRDKLGNNDAAKNAAAIMYDLLSKRKK